MQKYKFFTSIIWVAKNNSAVLKERLETIDKFINAISEDYEIVVVDNASEDHSIEILKELTKPEGIPNLQIFALTKEVNYEVASWAGLENSLGDYAIVIDPERDDLAIIKDMLAGAAKGKDVIFAHNKVAQELSFHYRLVLAVYNIALKKLAGLDVRKDIPTFRLLSKKVINYLLQFPDPAQQYRYLPATAGFSKETLEYESKVNQKQKKSLVNGIEKGISLLISTTKAPMRIVTTLSIFGTVANLVYSIYVLFIAFFKEDVAPGWVTLSLQQSGMFFLFSIVLFILGEYILHMSNLGSEGPRYHIAQELTSAHIRHREKLNITEQSHGTSKI